MTRRAKAVRRLSCRIFGHTYSRATTGLTGVAGKPVFRCRCGAEWITAYGWWSQRAHPTKRDHFTPNYQEAP